MKLCLAVISILVFVQASNSQPIDTDPWCPPGATWLYSMVSTTSQSYYQLSFIKDTSWQGKPVKQMSAKQVRYIGSGTLTRTETFLGFEYFYQKDDSIFFYDQNSFRFIYRFQPERGEKWVTGTSRYHFCAGNSSIPAQDSFHITAIDTITLNGKRFPLIRDSSMNKSFFMGDVIRNVGPLLAPYPVNYWPRCYPPGTAIDMGSFTGLTCYRDNLRGYVFNAPGASTCHSIITSLDPGPDMTSTTEISLFPNPAGSFLFLRHASGAGSSYIIYSAVGQMVLSGKLDSGQQINVSRLKPGIYLINIQIGKTTRKLSFLKS